MQIKSLRIVSYRSWRIDERKYSETAEDRHRKLELYQQLREEGCSEKTALKAIEISRATYYRYRKGYQRQGKVGLEPRSRRPLKRRQASWSSALEQQVLKLRKTYPLWGKMKLRTLLAREHDTQVSESQVGRILRKLRDRGKIRPVCFYYGRVKEKRARVFEGHAKRWKAHLKAKEPGQMIQIDHMKIYPEPGKRIIHFKATCPLTKITATQVYTRATSINAARFLQDVQQQLPFKVQSIQVDGGSEFRAEFEQACASHSIPLYVLPPRSPELNGHVERRNSTFKYEFYRLYSGPCSLAAIRPALKKYTDFYNTFRPHQSLNQLTPMLYFSNHCTGAHLSHM